MVEVRSLVSEDAGAYSVAQREQRKLEDLGARFV